MKHSTREELFEVLSGFTEHAPELRLGQLIANLAFLARGTGASDVWDVEDDELLEAARSHLLDLGRRTEVQHSETTA